MLQQQEEEEPEYEEDYCLLYQVYFCTLSDQLKHNPYEYELGATYDMSCRNDQHYWPLFNKVFYAYVYDVQEAEEFLLKILPANHPYIFKQNGRYPYGGPGYVYIISK